MATLHVVAQAKTLDSASLFSHYVLNFSAHPVGPAYRMDPDLDHLRCYFPGPHQGSLSPG